MHIRNGSKIMQQNFGVKTSRIQRLQERIKALEHANCVLEELCANEEMSKEKASEAYENNKKKWEKERITLIKANKEIVKMMEHVDKQIENIKEQP